LRIVVAKAGACDDSKFITTSLMHRWVSSDAPMGLYKALTKYLLK